MTFIRWISGALIALALAVLAISNTHTIPVYITPFHDFISLPLYVIGFGTMAAGFFAGILIVWFTTLPLRYDSFKQKRKIKDLEKKAHSPYEGGKQEKPPLESFFPSLPKKK